MAESISLTLTANEVDIEGDSTVTSLGRADTIEVLSLEQQLSGAFDRATLQPTGRRIYAPIRFTKRIDRSSPLLRKALTLNEPVAGAFRWYRPSPAGDGTTQHFFTVEFTGGRITLCKLRLPDVLDPATAALSPMEDVELTFNEITWTYVDGNVAHTDNWTSIS